MAEIINSGFPLTSQAGHKLQGKDTRSAIVIIEASQLANHQLRILI